MLSRASSSRYLAQYRLAGINHIQGGIGLEQLAQHFGFLFETLAGGAAGQKVLNTGRAVKAFVGASQLFCVGQQGHGIFQAGGIKQVQHRLAVGAQANPLNMAGGAVLRADFAETAVTGQGTQQRGFADIGVTHHGQLHYGLFSHASQLLLSARERWCCG
jgi:hypothetical protein